MLPLHYVKVLFHKVEPQLAGFDWDWKLVFLDRQWARREIGKGARRVIGAVEIEIDNAVLRQRRVQEPARLVGFRVAREVLEDEEQILVARSFIDRLETTGASLHHKLAVAWAVHRHELAEDVRDRHLLQLFVGHEARLKAIGAVERVVLESRKT